MGKYMRKRKRNVGRTTPAMEHGVRTRARSAAVASTASAAAASASAAAAAPAPKRPRKQTAARAEAEAAVCGNGGGATPGSCYLQLRSRRLFVPGGEGEVQCPVPPLPAAAAQRSSVASGEPVEAAGSSRCSSTASSVDVVLAVAPARERSGGEAEEACDEDYCDVESVVSDSAECRRERRETTPSSRAPVDPSDEECSQAADDPRRHRRRKALATATTAVACGARRMPPAEEIEQFFAAAEKAQAERFAAKYNFDVARGLPLGAGRYEWTPVASG